MPFRAPPEHKLLNANNLWIRIVEEMPTTLFPKFFVFRDNSVKVAL
jgi:hypothetical protein